MSPLKALGVTLGLLALLGWAAPAPAQMLKTEELRQQKKEMRGQGPPPQAARRQGLAREKAQRQALKKGGAGGLPTGTRIPASSPP